MKKGFGKYFKEGYKTSKKVFRKKEFNTFKYFLFQFASVLGVLCVFITPFFSLAKIKMVEQAVNEDTIHLFKAFENTDNPKKYMHSLLSIVLKIVLFIGGLLILSVLGVALFIIGYQFDILVDYYHTKLFYSLLLTIPAIVGAILFIIYFCIYTDPTNYFINSYLNATGSESLTYGFNTLRKQGKGKVFLINFLKVILNLAMIAIMVCATVALLFTPQLIPMIIEIIIAVVTFCIYVGLFPKINLALSIAKYNLYRDIQAVDKPLLQFQVNEAGDNVELKSDVKEEEVLLKLFDECDKKENEEESEESEQTEEIQNESEEVVENR